MTLLTLIQIKKRFVNTIIGGEIKTSEIFENQNIYIKFYYRIYCTYNFKMINFGRINS